MIVTTVTIHVKKEHIQEFIHATLENHRGSVKEPGNIRFDFVQSKDDPSRFLLFEVFESEEAISAHKRTDHYLKWKDLVGPWMAKPREGMPYKAISPQDRRDWIMSHKR
jgi:(4S)-4-hydroxy-5-phosphonooxypentane-2,3-dione isomerase